MIRHKGVQKIGNVIEGITKPAFKVHGFANQKIITYWSQIVGATLAKFTIPQKIIFPPHQTRAGTLYVGVTNPGLSLEIQAQESRIVEKIATFFGYQAVSRIKVSIVRLKINKETPVSAAPKQTVSKKEIKMITHQLDKIKDKTLQTQLQRLADTLFQTEA